jgi:cell division protein ZapE
LIAQSFPNLLTAHSFFELASQPVNAGEILADLIPPKHFERAEFSNYIPEPEYPSQAETLNQVQEFIRTAKISEAPNIFRLWKMKSQGKGLYLDGGFGVGKTHLLASAYHQFDGTKAYLSFQELMFLVGLLSLNTVADSFKNYKLLVIDEFELDDPANSRISTNLLGQLLDAGVSILTSSNTPPGALGEGKFSLDDFKRELGDLTNRFTSLRIDGDDYRQTHLITGSDRSTWFTSDGELDMLYENIPADTIFDVSFDEFLAALAKVHPMRIRRAIAGVDAVILHGITQISDPYEALRFVYFIDKAYDNDLLVMASSTVEIRDIFHRSYFSGGDTKKYRRTMSRLEEMTRTSYHRLNA